MSPALAQVEALRNIYSNILNILNVGQFPGSVSGIHNEARIFLNDQISRLDTSIAAEQKAAEGDKSGADADRVEGSGVRNNRRKGRKSQ